MKASFLACIVASHRLTYWIGLLVFVSTRTFQDGDVNQCWASFNFFQNSPNLGFRNFLIPNPFIYLFITTNLGRFQKIKKKIIKFQNVSFQTIHTSQFSKVVFRQKISNFLLFHELYYIFQKNILMKIKSILPKKNVSQFILFKRTFKFF